MDTMCASDSAVVTVIVGPPPSAYAGVDAAGMIWAAMLVLSRSVEPRVVRSGDRQPPALRARYAVTAARLLQARSQYRLDLFFDRSTRTPPQSDMSQIRNRLSSSLRTMSTSAIAASTAIRAASGASSAVACRW